MHAVQIKAFGPPTEVLHLVDLPEPAGPAAGEVLVGVEYAPNNMNDLYLRARFRFVLRCQASLETRASGTSWPSGMVWSISRSAIGS
jgi:NADPH:quinone reductase-like Zn-dependent oxidoreductase